MRDTLNVLFVALQEITTLYLFLGITASPLSHTHTHAHTHTHTHTHTRTHAHTHTHTQDAAFPNRPQIVCGGLSPLGSQRKGGRGRKGEKGRRSRWVETQRRERSVNEGKKPHPLIS